MNRLKRCVTCKKSRRADQYETPRARRCVPCWERIRADAFCSVCEAPVEIQSNGEKSSTCGAAECLHTAHVRNGYAGKARRVQLVQERTEKRCPWCVLIKPETPEFWSIAARDERGGIALLDGVCKSCRAASKRERVANDPEYRQKQRDYQKRRHAEIRARADVDPAIAAALKERWREQKRQAKEKAQEPVHAILVDAEETERLPVGPFREWLRTWQDERLAQGWDKLQVAALFEVNEKQVRRWLEEVDTITVATADQVFVQAGEPQMLGVLYPA